VGTGGSTKARRKVDGCWILRRDPRSEQREDYEDDDQNDAGGRQRTVTYTSGSPAAERDGSGDNVPILQADGTLSR